jgi:pimeloyl-ACP methyl ester carboxylesterase
MRVPALLLIGQQEVLYDPVAALERARRLLPNLKGELIPRASHAMTIERHEVVDERILAFLQAKSTAEEGSLAERETSPVLAAV